MKEYIFCRSGFFLFLPSVFARLTLWLERESGPAFLSAECPPSEGQRWRKWLSSQYRIGPYGVTVWEHINSDGHQLEQKFLLCNHIPSLHNGYDRSLLNRRRLFKS